MLKWGFVLITAYTGVVGTFLYVLGCREPLPGLHARYVASRWRQALGSTMHCVAGDGAGILAGAAIGALFHLDPVGDVALEYLVGFGFGWTVFQALFMRRMAGAYGRSLLQTFVPELVSMNALMAVMVPLMAITMARVPNSHHPGQPAFWFVMSMSLLAGFIGAYPVNWWLVARHLKHGMMTVRRPGRAMPLEPASVPGPVSRVPARHERRGTSLAPQARTAEGGRPADLRCNSRRSPQSSEANASMTSSTHSRA